MPMVTATSGSIDGEAGDHEVGRTRRVRGLHEVGAEGRRGQQADDAEHRAASRNSPLPMRLMTTLARVATKP